MLLFEFQQGRRDKKRNKGKSEVEKEQLLYNPRESDIDNLLSHNLPELSSIYLFLPKIQSTMHCAQIVQSLYMLEQSNH